MVWISLILLSFNIFAADLPKLLTKHSPETLRFITIDGKYAYIQKRPGVLGLVSSFKSSDFLTESSQSDFIISSSRFKRRLAIEVIPNTHTEFSLFKNHKILVVDWGNSLTKEIGLGKNAKLHLDDEWISYYNSYEKTIHLQNILTQKKYDIHLSSKTTPFFTPEVEMIFSDTIAYTDVNEKGYSALIIYNLITQKSSIIYKSSQNATKLEICQASEYLGIGEFPYEGADRGSKIMQIKIGSSSNLAGHTTLYDSNDHDLGNMICLDKHIYFIKTLKENKKLQVKTTEAAKLDLKSLQIEIKSSIGNVGQLISMDGRIIIPFRSDFFVLEGESNLSEDVLKSTPNSKEELPLEY
ncbi:MAG: hypothetical protein AB7I27_05545 [Bacteriovoracaceae bacterium]